MSFVLIVNHDSFEYDIPPVSLFGPFDTLAEAQAFAEDFREVNGLPREATPEHNEAWTDAGWLFAIVEPKAEVKKWDVPLTDDLAAMRDREVRPFIVGEVANPGVIERFTTHGEASEYIGQNFPPADVEAGRYYIDGPEASS